MQNNFTNLLQLICKVSTHRNTNSTNWSCAFWAFCEYDLNDYSIGYYNYFTNKWLKRESVNSKWELSWNLFTLNKYGGPPIIEGLHLTQVPKCSLY